MPQVQQEVWVQKKMQDIEKADADADAAEVAATATAEATAEKARLESSGGGVRGVGGAEAGNAAAGNVANKLDLDEPANSSECNASAKVSTA